jgi:hypothetical protein
MYYSHLIESVLFYDSSKIKYIINQYYSIHKQSNCNKIWMINLQNSNWNYYLIDHWKSNIELHETIDLMEDSETEHETDW